MFSPSRLWHAPGKKRMGSCWGWLLVREPRSRTSCPCRSRAKQVAGPDVVPHGLAVRIPGFHPGSPGSTPGVGKHLYLTYCAYFWGPREKEDAGLLERVQCRLPRWPGLEHRTAEGRLRDRAGSVQPREKARGRFHCCLVRRCTEDGASLFPEAHSGRMRGTSWSKGSSP